MNSENNTFPQKYPLTAGQQGLFFIQHRHPDCYAYNIPLCFELTSSQLDIEKLTQACQLFVNQHPILTTIFELKDGQPLQYMTPDSKIDFSYEQQPIEQQQLNQHLETQVNTPFDLTTGPICRFRLYKISSQRYVFIMVVHHIVFDGYSSLLCAQIFRNYQRLVANQEVPVKPFITNHANYQQYQQNWLNSDNAKQQLDFWQQQLNHVPPMNWPVAQPQNISFKGDSVSFILPADTITGLKQLSKQQANVTLSTICLAAYQILLGRYTTQTDITIGMPVSKRDDQGLQACVGYYVNMLPVRIQLDETLKVTAYLQQLSQHIWSCLDHSDQPFVNLVERLNIDRDHLRTAIFQVGYAFQDFSTFHPDGFNPLPQGRQHQFEPLMVTNAPLPNQNGILDLMLEIVWNEDGQTQGQFKYASDLFDRQTIIDMISHYQTLLKAMVERPNQLLADLPLLTQNQSHQQLIELNNTQAHYPNLCIHQLFEQQVANNPNALAVVMEQQLTYQQLDDKATLIAVYLQSQGIKTDQLVAIWMKRSVDMIITMLAILKAGGAYLPLDPECPKARINQILASAQPQLILTHEMLSPLSLEQFSVPQLCLNRDSKTIAQPKLAGLALKQQTQPNSLAYVLYTSGSTGQPKGVMIEHHSVVNLIYAFEQICPLAKDANCSAWTAQGFDVSVYEIFTPLLFGATLYPVPDHLRKDSQLFFNWLQLHQIHSAYIPPFYLKDYKTFISEHRSVMKRLLVGVEPIDQLLLEQISDLLEQGYIINGYGPTEATVCTSLYPILPQGERIGMARKTPIGKPLANSQLYILDKHLNPLPIGVPGELYISGEGLARGYLNDSQQTNERFIDNPFIQAVKMYRTGDFCRWNDDLNIEFMGRMDHQIKIRGYRVECSEIEVCLNRHPAIIDNVVLVEGQGETCQLICYYGLNQHYQQPIENQTLTAFATEWLPAHMIPSRFVQLTELPLTPNGKVDRKALKQMDVNQDQTQPQTAKTANSDLETQMLGLWQRICNRQDIRLDDNFFDIGGNSLLSLQLVQKANDLFKSRLATPLTTNDIFEHPTIAQLTQLIQSSQSNLMPPHTLSQSSQANTLHQLFCQQVAKNPDACALVFEQQELSYRQLDHKANQLALYLHLCQVKPNTLVSVCLERSVELIIAILAILKAGGAYVPLDPSYPSQRLAYLLEHSQTPIILTETALLDKFQDLTQPQQQLICIDGQWQQKLDDHGIAVSIPSRVKSDDLAYVIYTSGSSGSPKGVMVEHQSVINLCQWHQQQFALRPDDHSAFFSSIAFDAAVWEIFPYLLAGATVHILAEKVRHDVEQVQLYLSQHPITITFLTTQMCELLLKHSTVEFLQHNQLRVLLTGGETLTVKPTEEHKFQLFNNYGPTENTVVTTSTQIKPTDQQISIGQAINHNCVYILDSQLRPVDDGSIGELHIGGENLARGYLNDPELTSQRFIDNPFTDAIEGQNNPPRLYKTGDLVKRLADGNIAYVGRKDSQVKIRGFRIECTEIEAWLKTHPGIKAAVVVIHNNTSNKKLCAFYTLSNQHTTVTDEQLKNHLQNILPAYMLPSKFIQLDHIPLTPNGKVDRKQLGQQTQTTDSDTKTTNTRHALDELLLSLWQPMFDDQPIEITDDFFALGGDSLAAMSLTAQLNQTLKPQQKIKTAHLLSYPTIETMSDFIGSLPSLEQAPLNDIAIIGMSCRFPGSDNIEQFWHNLYFGKEGIQFFSQPKTADKPQAYVAAKGYLNGLKTFAGEFFGYSPQEAKLIDPQQRLFLEEAYHAIEDACYDPNNYSGKIGVYGGTGYNHYRSQLERQLSITELSTNYQLMLGNGADFLASRVAYKLNLKGPTIVTQTACSTSLVAIDRACQDIIKGECDMALAGGVSLQCGFEKTGYYYQPGMILSPDGHCRPFDKQAQGTVPGHGVGVVVLKSLTQAIKDGDNIHAVIKGSAINNDGGVKVGFTAPSVTGQKQVIQQAQKKAKIKPEQISYVEAHGTATPLGDPIEHKALSMVFGTNNHGDKLPNGSCAIGSVKSNIGHTDAASGVAGLIKTILCLQHQTLVPTLHFNQPNSTIDLANSPFYVNTKTQKWLTPDNQPRIAAVSAFGIGGTNAHVIVAQAPKRQRQPSSKAFHLLPISAKTATALAHNKARLFAHIRHQQHNQSQSLADIAYSLQVGRSHMEYRDIVVVDQNKDINQQLESHQASALSATLAKPRAQLIWMFPGQGSQFPNMAKALYIHQPVFKQTVDYCCQFMLQQLGVDLKPIIYPQDSKPEQDRLQQTQYSQISLFIIEYAMAKLWQSFDLHPQAMIGHSIGEYVAACISGVFELEPLLMLIWKRGQLMQSMPTGDMLAIALSQTQVQHYLEPSSTIDIALTNHPQQTVVSGSHQDIGLFQDKLTKAGVNHVLLPTSHAFHSRMMEPVMAQFAAAFEHINLQEPKIKFISSLTGGWITPAQATDSAYWCQQLRHQVKFAQGAQTLFNQAESEQQAQIFMEIGPGRVLTGYVKRHPELKQTQRMIATSRHPAQAGDDNQFFLTSLANLWRHGVKINWAPLYADEHRYRVSLPGYAFERQEYWIGASEKPTTQPDQDIDWMNAVAQAKQEVDQVMSKLLNRQQSPQSKSVVNNNPSTTDIKTTIIDLWQQYLGVENISEQDDFFTLGGDSLIAVNIVAKLKSLYQLNLSPSIMIEHNKVTSLAKYIGEHIDKQQAQQTKEKPSNSSIVSIQAGNPEQAALFMVHPAGGQVYFYRSLATTLGANQPVYGIQSLLDHNGQQQHVSIEAMASHYIEDLRRAFPHQSNFILGGASLGGIIANEMAFQLKQQGISVNALVMIDAPGPGYMPKQLSTSAELLAYLGDGKIDIDLEQLTQMTLSEQIEHVKQLERQSSISAIFPPDLNENYLRTLKAQGLAMHQHQFKPFDGNAIYFKPQQKMEIMPADMDRAWIELIKGELEVKQVPGDHITMNMKPNVKHIGKILRRWLSNLNSA